MNPPPPAGPFIILGVDKDVDPAALPAIAAERLEAVRRGELQWSEADVLAAVELLRSRERRLAADADNFNADLASGEVRRLARLYHLDGSPPGWEPMDPEPPADLPDAELDAAALAASLPAPDVPLELPSVAAWLLRYGEAANDPWTQELNG
jgi:hypothetical protein